MKYFLFILLFLVLAPAQAVELFGVQLGQASRDQFRSAIKKSGAKLISEAGIDEFYDVYESSRILHNSRRLYLGFVKKDGKFAFAEYEFNGLQQRGLLAKLVEKYGKGQKTSGKYLSDTSWQWQVNGIHITLQSDWQAFTTRLVYRNPDALKLLKQEQTSHLANLNQQQDAYLRFAY